MIQYFSFTANTLISFRLQRLAGGVASRNYQASVLLPLKLLHRCGTNQFMNSKCVCCKVYTCGIYAPRESYYQAALCKRGVLLNHHKNTRLKGTLGQLQPLPLPNSPPTAVNPWTASFEPCIETVTIWLLCASDTRVEASSLNIDLECGVMLEVKKHFFCGGRKKRVKSMKKWDEEGKKE